MESAETQPERDVLVSENRIGIFKVSRALLEQAATKLLKVLEDVLVIDVVRSPAFMGPDVFTFKAYSPRFSPVVEGSVMPEYEFVIEDIAPGTWIHSVRRIEQEKH